MGSPHQLAFGCLSLPSPEASDHARPIVLCFSGGSVTGRSWKKNFEEFIADAELARQMLVQRLAGGETMDEICYSRQIPPSLVAAWIAGDEELSEACAVAERLYVDGEVKRALRIVDGTEGEDEQPGPNAAKPKERAEFRKWMAERLNRKRYGEKVQHEVSGEVALLPQDRAALVMETARALMWLTEQAGVAEREMPAVPQLPAPIEHQVPPPVAKPQRRYEEL